MTDNSQAAHEAVREAAARRFRLFEPAR